MHTNDGGSRWELHAESQKHSLVDVYFIDEKQGWAAGNQGKIINTKNGGKSWQTFTVKPKTCVINRLHFTDRKFGWAVGKNGKAFQTTDGGESWNLVDLKTLVSLYGVYFINKDMGWVVGMQGTVLFSNNGGKQWKKLRVPVQHSGFFDIYFINDKTGWVVGDRGYILRTDSVPKKVILRK